MAPMARSVSILTRALRGPDCARKAAGTAMRAVVKARRERDLSGITGTPVASACRVGFIVLSGAGQAKGCRFLFVSPSEAESTVQVRERTPLRRSLSHN